MHACMHTRMHIHIHTHTHTHTHLILTKWLYPLQLGHVNEFTVTQFHFTSWPDHGVPSVTTTMLMFVRRVQALCASLPEDSGPITVHCSAGVGRTGCYIVIDSALTRLKEKLSTIDIYGHVNLLRSQRPYMVQHEVNTTIHNNVYYL